MIDPAKRFRDAGADKLLANVLAKMEQELIERFGETFDGLRDRLDAHEKTARARPKASLQPGDIVWMKTRQGPKMAVGTVHDAEGRAAVADCVWANNKGTKFEAGIPLACLELVDDGRISTDQAVILRRWRRALKEHSYDIGKVAHKLRGAAPSSAQDEASCVVFRQTASLIEALEETDDDR